jgi:peptide chain release factor
VPTRALAGSQSVFSSENLAGRVEAKLKGVRSAAEQEIARIRRQKKKRSRRAKLKLLADKRHRTEKKSRRATVRPDHDD